jgi:hypothetical protein
VDKRRTALSFWLTGVRTQSPESMESGMHVATRRERTPPEWEHALRELAALKRDYLDIARMCHDVDPVASREAATQARGRFEYLRWKVRVDTERVAAMAARRVLRQAAC